MEDLIRVFEVPELRKLGTRSAIAKWLKSGALEGRKIAGRWFTTPAAVKTFIQGTKPAEARNGR